MNQQKQSNKINFLHGSDIQTSLPEMSNNHLPKWSIILVIVISTIVIGLIGYFCYQNYFNSDESVVCTMEAKICPDGSSVGRVPPSCEFAECPDSTGNKITNFEECVKAGYPILESYPRQCKTSDDRFFTEEILCRDENYECTINIPCCPGLKEVGLCFDENGKCICADCGFICLPCGNGICDDKENKCNCPEDCQE